MMAKANIKYECCIKKLVHIVGIFWLSTFSYKKIKNFLIGGSL